MQDLALDNSSNPSAAISYGWNIAAEIGVGKKIRQENRIIVRVYGGTPRLLRQDLK